MAQYVFTMNRVGKIVPPKRQILKDISLSFFPGAKIGVLGLNGAGKSTLLKIMAGVDKDIEGEAIPMPGINIGYLPQEASIFRKMTVWDNLMSLLETRKDLSEKAKIEKAEALLEEFHITHVKDTRGDALSGGERRRVEIARSLTLDPSFILLDEPFAGVDPLAVEDIQSVVMHLKTRGIGILITDHNVRETLRIVDKAYILSDGKILLSGKADDIAVNPTARKHYLGENFSL